MTGGAGGEVVGRISIKVVPELGQFRAEMAAELAKWDNKEVHIKVVADGVEKVKAQVANAAKDATAKVKTTADTKGVREKIKAAAEGVTARVKVEVDDKVLNRFERRLAGAAESAVSKYEPEFNLTVADEKLRRLVESRLAELKGLAALPVNVDPEIATKDKLFLEAEFQKLLAIMQAHADAQPIKIDLKLDEKATNDILKRVAKTKAENERQLRDSIDKLSAEGFKDRGELGKPLVGTDTVRIKAELDAHEAEAQRLAWKARIAADKITQKVKVEPNADLSGFVLLKAKIEALFANIRLRGRNSGKGLTAADLLPDIGDVAKEAADLTKELAGGLAKAGTGAALSLPSLLSFGGILLVIAGAIAVLLPPLLALGAGLITLTPGLLAFAAPMGAIALGLDGIKKAATNAGLFEDSNGAKKGGGTIGAALDAIKQKVSDTFEKGLTPAFEKLGGLFNNTGFQNGMVAIADGLTNVAQGFIDAVTSSTGMENIRSIVSNIGTGLTNAAPGVRDFTEAILELVQGISTKFPGLGTWFSELMAGFREDMVDMTKPGEDGMSRLDHLISGVRNGLEGLTGIFQAFWNQGLSSIQDPSFGQHMLDFFDKVKQFCTVTLPTLADGFEAFASALNAITGPFETIGNLIDKMEKVPFMGKLVEKGLDFAGALTGVGGYTGQLKDLVTQAIDSDGTTEAANKAGQKAGQAMGDGLKTGLLGGAVLGVGGGSDITGAISAQLGQITTASVEAQKEALRSAFSGDLITDAVKGQIGMKMQGVTAEVQAQMNALGPVLDEAINSALVPLTTMPAKVGTAFQTMQGAVTASFGFIVLAIGAQAQNITNAVGQAFDGIPARITSALGQTVSAAATGAGQIVTAISSSLAQLPGIVSQTFNALATIATTAIGQMVQAIVAAGPQIQSAMSGWSGIIAAAGQQMAGVARSSGVAVGQAFASGIASMTGVVQASAAGLMQAARAFFPNSPAKEGPFSGAGWIDKSGESIGIGFADGMDSSMGKVVSTARALMQAIKDVFGDASGLTLNFNFGGVQEQMGSIASSAKSFSDSMGSALPAVKPGKIDAATQSQLDQLRIQKEQLDVSSSRLRAEKNLTGDKGQKAAIQQQLDQLNIQKQSLEAQIAQLSYQGKYQSSVGETKDLWEGMNQKIVDGVSNVGQGVVQSYASDLGISGNGALSTIGQQALQFGSQFIFNVSNVDDAMSVQQMQQRKQAMTYGG